MPQRRTFWINAYQLLLQLWEGMFTLVFLALFTMNVQFLCLSYKCTLLWVYHNILMFSMKRKVFCTMKMSNFVIFRKGLTHRLSWKIENWTLFVFVLNRLKNSICWCFRWKERRSGLWKCPVSRVAIISPFSKVEKLKFELGFFLF